MRSVVAIAAIVLNGLFLLLGACAGTETQVHAAVAPAARLFDSTAASPPPEASEEEVVPIEPAPELERPPLRRLGEDRRGEATYFRPGARGSCGVTPDDGLVAAFGPALHARQLCGQCAEVKGPKGTVVVTLNDRCEGCKGSSIDLSTRAFTQIAEKTDGRVGITWHLVDCP